MHARQQIRAAFYDALVPTGVTILNGSVYPVHDGILPCMIVYARNEEVDSDIGGKDKIQARSAEVSVQIYAKASLPTIMDDVLDDLAEQAETAILGNLTLLGMVRCLDLTATEIEISADGEKQIATATLTFSAKYMTRDGVPGVIL